MKRPLLAPIRRPNIVVSVTLAGVLVTGITAGAQTFKDLQTAETPLILKAQGSFFVGGEKVQVTQPELGMGPAGHITVDQMYVRYMIPQGAEANPAVVMVHGATLTGKSWETTPDGRMGWDEYFVRKGHSVFVPDQVRRGRSGFNQAVFNAVRAGSVPPSEQPGFIRFSDENNWPTFRFGSKVGVPFPDGQFPVTAMDEISKQGVPDLSRSFAPGPNATIKGLAELASQVGGAVLMGHSQSGTFPLEAALINPSVVKGAILVEPGGCREYTEDEVKVIATVPMLGVYGDHRENTFWQRSFDACQALFARVRIAGGKAEMLDPPTRGIRGNSHMIMLDKNNQQIADILLKWIGEHVRKGTTATRP
jgi:pimeloyl-ACP methyl ester carboxylesterase